MLSLKNIKSKSLENSLDTKIEDISFFRRNIKRIGNGLKIVAYNAVIGLTCAAAVALAVRAKDAKAPLNLNSIVKDSATYPTLMDKSIKYDSAIDWVESTGWTITSYGDVNEALYNGSKIEIFDRESRLLGFYREDFLRDVMINGAGIGDGNGNDKTKFLHYDYDINDGRTCYLANVSLGAYNNKLMPWTGEKPSVAVNPVLPYGTKIRLKDLGHDGGSIPEWIQDLLLSKMFYADDKFHLSEEDRHKKKIDVYVGLIEGRDYNYQSLYMENVTIIIESNPDFNNDGVIDLRDLKILADNWLWSGPIGANKADINLDGKVDFRDYAYYSLRDK